MQIGIVAGGPVEKIPNLDDYPWINFWIGVDHGALYLAKRQMKIDLAIGDFDSISQVEHETIQTQATTLKQFPADKDYTDLELAIDESIELNAKNVWIFGATGGRLDHAWVNMFLLKKLAQVNIAAKLVDRQNQLSLHYPGTYSIEKEQQYPYVSFLSITEQVEDLTLEGFRYNLDGETITFGSSFTVSNECIEKKCTYSFSKGILLVIKSRD
ncbi:thiamine diphosphokinase [Allobacillus sp. GCM10007491]|uniref:Thiamine diphosphokinase n=1 Tax=Allobacillus saliphilus TaxID=2912308 RepID=A0A941HSC0_9BACI|nr:thiamine diphosphokinase [Allobacillus saliphilus]MBR7552832.1 thiamine diphosphokinase [Allobacillus saliphilus]